jgi:hypothetical protein
MERVLAGDPVAHLSILPKLLISMWIISPGRAFS